MKRPFNIRAFLSLLLMAAMFSPTAVLAFGDGKKHFKQGMKHESAEEWDKAAEEFALAVADNSRNPEYRLHLMRSLFMASQMYIKKGTLAAQEKDYQGGYVAFRKAYAYDPTNDFAKSEMARMVRLQEAENGTLPGGKKDDKNFVPASYGPQANPAAQMPQRLEKLRDITFPSGVDLQAIIKELARDLDLNVLFDTESFRTAGRKTNIELKGVTAARALDYIFLQEGLFFQRVGPHTIMVAGQQQRTKFQQLVLRTFYLANASPKDIAKVVQTAIPAQPGRSQTIVLTDDATNSVTIRDTEENIRLIGQLIKSLDKDRAEVVMDVAIYEVNKNDLLQFGNQVGSATTLTNMGGAGFGSLQAGGAQNITSGLPFKLLDLASVAFALPISSFQAFQAKSNTKLIASTQIHAFNNEDSSARIGQRVPVQSAQIYNGNNTGGNTGTNPGFVSNVINYEQVGLTLKFKPLVFPNQDVQVAMEIESKDVAGASTLTPTFTERTIKGTARVQNNKTLLLASVAQGVETNGRSGIPILGLIPILGRLFTAPTRDNRQVDIVIAVTPRVIRAPAILPEDEIERPTGSLAVPTQNSLEAMVIEDEQQDLLAAARRVRT
ncbi:MAG: secretin N-terminal domain-containing protein, partial [Pyrinomonadaceae bacterium]